MIAGSRAADADAAWRVLAGRDRPVYLHFLNREMARAVNAPFEPIRNERRLLLAAVLSDRPLLSTLAFAWESSLPTGPDSAVLLLRAADQLELLSEHVSLDRFLGSVQHMYRDEPHRYAMYFEPSAGSEVLVPTKTKRGSTTRALEEGLRNILERPHGAKELRVLSEDDAEQVGAGHGGLGELLDRRDGRALTLSLLRQVDGLDATAAGRLLSSLHLGHYLDELGADIVTDLPGLEYFDPAAREPPRLRSDLAGPLLARAGLRDAGWQRAADGIVALRARGQHRVALGLLRTLMAGAYEVALRAGGTERPTRADLAAAVRDFLGELTFPVDLVGETLPDRLVERLSQLMLAAELRHDWFRVRKAAFIHSAPSLSRVMLLVANETERDAVIAAARDAGGPAVSRRFVRRLTVFELGVFGGAEVLLVPGGQGTESPVGMTVITSEVIRDLQPQFIMLLGIAYGLRDGEQNLEDVLVSSQVRVLDPVKVTDVSGETRRLRRGDETTASALLIDRCSSATTTWTGPKVHFGPILAKNTLVNDRALRTQLKEDDPDAIGGEMEGAGVYSGAARAGIDWIMVKGISDWGFNKEDVHRPPAAANAARFALHVIAGGGLSTASVATP